MTDKPITTIGDDLAYYRAQNYYDMHRAMRDAVGDKEPVEIANLIGRSEAEVRTMLIGNRYLSIDDFSDILFAVGHCIKIETVKRGSMSWELILPTTRSCKESDFEAWCARLNELSAREPHRYGPDAVESCGADSWRAYYDNGYSPENAWSEDGTYVD